MSETIEPYRIGIPQAALDDLRERLARTRFPDAIEGAGWEYGIPIEYLRELVASWRDAYDWREHEARLNEHAHFRTRIDGQAIHFLEARSAHADAVPLLLVHGWPGSILEFEAVIPRLVDPTAHGGSERDAFHVIAPSLPGYGFSEPPRTRGWDVSRIVDAFAELMRRLGFARYAVQGGDWGAQVATRLAARDAEHCFALHTNMPIASPPAEPVELGDRDKADLADMARFQNEEGAYALLQGTKPQTLGAALHDSPSGLLAWIVEKFHAWSDCDGHPENVFTREQLLTNVSLYWLTGTAASSARLYRESRVGGLWNEKPAFVEVPTGVARYPKEVLRFPRPWVERQYHVVHWVDMPRGGHFAAMEQPALFVDDLRTFFGSIRGALR